MRRIVLILVCLCSPALGATAPERVAEHALVIVKMETGERATVFSANFAPVEVYRGFDGICFTGAPGRYAVLVVPTGDAPIQTLFVTIEGEAPPPVPPGPTPPGPTPPPQPTGFAAEVKAKAADTGDKEGAKRLASTFRTIASEIGTKHTTIQQVYNATREATRALALPSAQWTPFNNWLSAQLTQRAQTMDSVRTTYAAIVEGLEAAAK